MANAPLTAAGGHLIITDIPRSEENVDREVEDDTPLLQGRVDVASRVEQEEGS